MSTILSIPGISLLFNNYSASSLNLLFFYLTWSTLVLSHPPLRVEVLTSLAVRVVFYIIPGILFCIFDAILPSLADKAPSSTVQRYGLRSAARKSTKTSGGGFVSALGYTLFNTLVGVGIQAGIELLLVDVLKSPERALAVTTTLPLPWDAALAVLEASIIREVLVYYPHRRIHRNQPPYPLLPGKISHTDPSHASCLGRSSVSLGDYLVLQFIPTYLPAVALRMHVLTYLLFTTVVCVTECLAYSGYDALPGFFMMGRVGRRVRAHGEGGGKGGYGWLGWLDWIHGTDAGGDSEAKGKKGGRRGRSR